MFDSSARARPPEKPAADPQGWSFGNYSPTATLWKGQLGSIPPRPPEAQDQRLRNVNTEKLGRKGKRREDGPKRMNPSKEDEVASNRHKHRDSRVEGPAWKRRERKRDAGDCERRAGR